MEQDWIISAVGPIIGMAIATITFGVAQYRGSKKANLEYVQYVEHRVKELEVRVQHQDELLLKADERNFRLTEENINLYRKVAILEERIRIVGGDTVV